MSLVVKHRPLSDKYIKHTLSSQKSSGVSTSTMYYLRILRCSDWRYVVLCCSVSGALYDVLAGKHGAGLHAVWGRLRAANGRTGRCLLSGWVAQPTRVIPGWVAPPTQVIPGLVAPPTQVIPGLVAPPTQVIPVRVAPPTQVIPGRVAPPTQVIPGLVAPPTQVIPGLVAPPTQVIPGLVAPPTQVIPGWVAPPTWDIPGWAALHTRVIPGWVAPPTRVIPGWVQDRDRDRDWDMVQWVVWFYVEPFTLDLSGNTGQYPIVQAPAPVAETASVITSSRGCLARSSSSTYDTSASHTERASVNRRTTTGREVRYIASFALISDDWRLCVLHCSVSTVLRHV